MLEYEKWRYKKKNYVGFSEYKQ